VVFCGFGVFPSRAAGQPAGDATRDTRSPGSAATASETGPPAVPGPVERAAVRAGGPKACCDVALPLQATEYAFWIWLTDSDPHASPMKQCDFEKGSLLCGQRGLTRFAIATQQHVGKRVSILLGSRSVPLGTLAILRGASAVLEGIRVVAAVDE
jgi:hypothetical protein